MDKTKSLKDFSMSLALIQSFWDDEEEEFIKMKTLGSNNQKFWLWKSRVEPKNLPFQSAPQVSRWSVDNIMEWCPAYIHLIFKSASSKLWLATYVLIKGKKALNMYFKVPICVCTYMELHSEIFNHHSKSRRHTYDRLWLTPNSRSWCKADLSCIIALHKKAAGSPKSRTAKWTEEQDKTQVNFQQFSALCRKDLNWA